MTEHSWVGPAVLVKRTLFSFGRRYPIITETDRHLRQPVIVLVVKKKRVLPVVTEIGNVRHPVVGFQKYALTVVVGQEITAAHPVPGFDGILVPVDIVEHTVVVGIQEDHVMRHVLTATSIPGVVVGNHLQIGVIVSIVIIPVDHQIILSPVGTVAVTVDHQAVAIGISFKIPFLHIIVIINPLHRQITVDDRPQHIRIPVTVQIDIPDRVHIRQRQPERGQREVALPESPPFYHYLLLFFLGYQRKGQYYYDP